MQFDILLFASPDRITPRTRCWEVGTVEGLDEAVREALRQLAADGRADYAWLMHRSPRALRGRETLPSATVSRDRVHISKFSWEADDFALPAAAVLVPEAIGEVAAVCAPPSFWRPLPARNTL